MNQDTSRQGFTLIELLIVTVVIATLMGVVFRLAGAGGDSRKKAVTIDRLQRIENALSGYYAAYGSYPPVPLQGRSRSIYRSVDENGVQETGSGESGYKIPGGDAKEAWDKVGSQILAACKAQPVAVYFPFNAEDPEVREGVKALAAQRVRLGASKRNFGVINNIGGFDLDKSDWRECAIFQFGLLSFLLPRYLFMLEGDTDLYDHVNQRTRRRSGQWAANNQLPCKMKTGDQYQSWKDIQKALHAGQFYRSGGGGAEGSMISNLTSQSVCARWMPNFEGIISGGRVFYGIKTADPERPYPSVSQERNLAVHSPKGYAGKGGGGGSNYLLDGMTIVDGWDHDFYYYSEPPFQSYKLWSAGPDGRTFPVWYDRGLLDEGAKEVVRKWTEDDIFGLNN